MAVSHDFQVHSFSSDLHNAEFLGDGFDLEPTANLLSMTGINPGYVAQHGDEIVIRNRGAFTVTLKHNDAGSAAANRFKFASGVDYMLTPGETVWATRVNDLSEQSWWVQP